MPAPCASFAASDPLWDPSQQLASETLGGGGLDEAGVDHCGRVKATGFFVALDQLVDETLEVGRLERWRNAQDVVGPEVVGDIELALIGDVGPVNEPNGSRSTRADTIGSATPLMRP